MGVKQGRVFRARVVAWVLGCAVVGACTDGTGPGGGGEEVPAVTVSIATDQDHAEISPYIYGSNQDRAGSVWTVRRLGGDALTGYNWENNFTSAGINFRHASGPWMLPSVGLPESDTLSPGAVIGRFHEQSLAMGATSIITLPVAGYVAADGLGTVPEAEAAPSPRWVRVLPRKGSPLSLSPDRTDGTVYVDEEVNYLVNRFGPAGSARGVRFYNLDNEPCLWASTHPRIHPARVAAREVLEKGIATAAAIKAVDPAAEVLGPTSSNIMEYVSCYDAPDWTVVGAGHGWFIEYYLDGFRAASQAAGRRLLDVLDVHFWGNGQADHDLTSPEATTPADQDARLQMPRILYEAGFNDNWVFRSYVSYLPMLPTLHAAIDRAYPGTKLSISEYNYGGGGDFSGGLAQVDVLGAYGRYGVYLATLWGLGEGDAYTASAFRLFLDYNGKGGTYGTTAVRATTSDRVRTAVYASLDPQNALHIMLVNRKRGVPLPVHFQIAGPGKYTSATVWGFGGRSPMIVEFPAVATIRGNAFDYAVPAITAVHIILK